MIQVRALTRSINTGTHRVDILKGIDLEIPRGQFAAIMGPSGSGTSTLLGLLAGLDIDPAWAVDGPTIVSCAGWGARRNRGVLPVRVAFPCEMLTDGDLEKVQEAFIHGCRKVARALPGA